MSAEGPPPTSGGLQYMQTTEQGMKNSMGTDSNWGMSPAFDLVGQLPRGVVDGDVEEPINILLDSAGDIRHLLCTLSRARRHTDREIRFFVYEPNLKHMARHVYFLVWFLEQTDLNSLDDAAQEFLEVYGNALLRESSYSCLKRVSKRAANIARGGADAFSDLIDLETFVKMKEVDWISDQLEAWHNESAEFNVDKQWDNRVRADVGDRYDSKHNLMDWDFNTGLMPYTPHVRWPEYKDWRSCGIAYDWGRVNPKRGATYEYTRPNKSLAVFVDRKRRFGVYQGDVRSGPYAAMGIDTEYPDLKKKQHDGSFALSNGVLAMHNVRAWLYEFLTGSEWQFSEFKTAWDAPDYVQKQDPEKSVRKPPPRFKFIMLGLDPDRCNLLLRTKLADPVRFDVVYQGTTSGFAFTDSVEKERPAPPLLVAPKGYLAVETVKFCVFLDGAQKDAYRKMVTEKLAKSKWVPCPPLNKAIQKNQPAYHLAFSRTPDPKLTDAQQKEKDKNDSDWILCFTQPGASNP